MDLAQRQIGMMALDLLGIPAVSDPVECDHPDFDPRPRNDRFSLGIRFDMGVGHGSHDELPAAGNEDTEPLLLDGIGSPTTSPERPMVREAVALYASASEFESRDLTPEGVPPKAADFSCFLPGKNFFFTIFLPQRQHCGDLLRSNHHGLSSSSLQPRGRLP